MFDESPEIAALRTRLDELRSEHAALNAQVDALAQTGVIDQLKFARLKKQKLHLKDEIQRIEDQLHPDIIA